MLIAQKVRAFIHERMNIWLTKRMPANQSYVLNGRSIFIFPSYFGFSYLFVLVLLFLLGTNYQNNLILLLCFMLASVFITTMLHSYFNLSGLEISLKKPAEGFCGDKAEVLITCKANNERISFTANFEQPDALNTKADAVLNNIVAVPLYLKQRGQFKAPRLKLISKYPFGLFNAWTKVDLSVAVIAYPKKLSPPEAWLKQFDTVKSNVTSQEGNAVAHGTEDFYQLNQYQQGQPLSQVAWKQAAKGKGLLSKGYIDQISSERYLTLTEMPATNIEVKLSYLSFLVDKLSNEGSAFGLDLLGERISSNHGSAHRKLCLNALANFKQDTN